MLRSPYVVTVCLVADEDLDLGEAVETALSTDARLILTGVEVWPAEIFRVNDEGKPITE